LDTISQRRQKWFSVLAVVLALVFGLLLFGWVGLVLGWFASGDSIIHRVHDVGGSGVGTGILIATPLLLLAWRRDDVGLLQAIAFAALAYGIAALMATDWVSLLYVPIVAVALVVMLAVGRGWRRFAALGAGLDPIVAVAAIVTAPVWIAFALTMARLQRIGPPNDPHVQMHHWTGMAAMGLGLLLVAGLASFRTRGWRPVAWLAGVGSIVYGIASAVFARFEGSSVPYPGSEGVAWGLLAVAWGVAFIAVVEARRLREGQR